MAFDYSGLLSTAERLLTRFGRPVVLTRASRTPADPAKPWGARAQDQSDTEEIPTTGVFLDPEDSDPSPGELGLADRRRVTVLVPAVPTLPETMGPDWQVQDGNIRYQIISVSAVQPGDTLLYYRLEARL